MLACSTSPSPVQTPCRYLLVVLISDCFACAPANEPPQDSTTLTSKFFKDGKQTTMVAVHISAVNHIAPGGANSYSIPVLGAARRQMLTTIVMRPREKTDTSMSFCGLRSRTLLKRTAGKRNTVACQWFCSEQSLGFALTDYVCRYIEGPIDIGVWLGIPYRSILVCHRPGFNVSEKI